MYVHCVVERCISVGRKAFDQHAEPTPIEESIQLLADEWKNIRDQPNGKISGKTTSGETDDLAISACMNIYWSFCIRAARAYL